MYWLFAKFFILAISFSDLSDNLPWGVWCHYCLEITHEEPEA